MSVGYFGSALGGLTGDFAGFKEDNLGKATEHAVAQATEYLIAQLDGIEWEGTVMMVKGSKIICNRGSREGVDMGMQFAVGEIEELVDDPLTEPLDIERLARDEVRELLALDRCDLRVSDVVEHTALLDPRTEDPSRHAETSLVPGSELREHANDIRNDVPGLLDDHRVPNADIETFDLLRIVQRRT